jgi:sialate O-acetylesterase
MQPRFLLFTVPLLLTLQCAAHAEVKPHSLFCENAVLQQKAQVPIWGSAADGEKVTVEFCGQSLSTVATNGRWKVTLEPLDAGGPFTMKIAGVNTITFTNVLVGEVWVCSGQSNMAFEMAGVRDAKKEIAEANFPQIRMWHVRHGITLEPQEQCDAFHNQWMLCTPATVGPFSAVGYFFARDLHQKLGVPIGMIHTSWGATSAAQWTSEEALLAEPKLKPVMDFKRKVVNDYIQSVLKLVPELQTWKTETEAATAPGRAPQMPPYIQQRLAPDPLNLYTHLPTGVFNAMLNPITPASIRGVIWYQGEQDSSQAESYRTGFPTMIRDWRQRFRNPELPFLYVQISTINASTEQPQERSAWAELREVQATCLDVPHTAMVVSADLGDVNDPHPRNKQDVGKRLARAARATVYGEKIAYQGPTYKQVKVENGKIRIHFDHLHGGLVTTDKEPPKGFAIAGEDKKFVWAKAKIDGNTVLVWSETVPQPVAVRYAWADMPLCNLTNKEGLPVVPFRTHPW